MPRDRPSVSNGPGADEAYIEHRVSKLDTLAGIAIKYGVEVADVKRMNGLVTDLQMFAHNTLRVPLHGRHFSSMPIHKARSLGAAGSSVSQKNALNVNDQAGPSKNPELRNREKKPLSSAMDLLRGYYGLSSPAHQSVGEGMEMTLYRSDSEDYFDDKTFSPETKSATTLEDDYNVFANGFHSTELDSSKSQKLSRLGNEYALNTVVSPQMGMADVDKSCERSVRRRSKVDLVNPTKSAYEAESWHDMHILDRVLPSCALSFGTEIFGGRNIGMLKGLDGAMVCSKGKDVSTLKMIKSSSTSNLQDPYNLLVSSGGSKHGTKLEIKSANQTNLSQGISRPLFQGLSKPAGYRHKAALD